MLDGLDDIDWARLGHAYGTADDVPDQLRALLSPDPATRDEALGGLYTNVFHQGSRFEASAYAVPFLLELLADPATPDPAAVLGLLSALAIGPDEGFLPEGFPVAEYRRAAEGGRELLAAKPPPWTGTDESKKEYVEYAYVESLSAAERGRLWAYVELATYDAVCAGVPLFRTLLTHVDPGVRTVAAYALAWFPEEADGSVSALAGAAAAATTRRGVGPVDRAVADRRAGVRQRGHARRRVRPAGKPGSDAGVPRRGSVARRSRDAGCRAVRAAHRRHGVAATKRDLRTSG